MAALSFGCNMSVDEFHHAVECLRSPDSLLYDEGYNLLQGNFLRRHLDALIELMAKEADPVIRGRFIELLGDSGEPRVIPLLESELGSGDDEIRRWALHALDCVATPVAKALALSYRTLHPEDDW
jgi:HEAT repeat protein